MNPSTRRAAFLGLLLTLAVPVALAADPMSKATGPSTLSRSDMKFFQKAAQTGMFEVQAAAIATSRALAPATKDFASRMATEHEANDEALKELATSKGVTLPTQLDENHREVLEKLQKEESKEFDERYAKVMREGHKEAIELFKETAKESKDADIRAFATSTLPVLQQHLDKARQLTAKS
jgi:putative membrane protein